MDDRHVNADGSAVRPKPWLDQVLEAMDTAGEAIIASVSHASLPKRLTAFAGSLSLAGTLLIWYFQIRHWGFGPHSYFLALALPVVAVSALAIILLALFTLTKPGKANSPAASLVAFTVILFLCFWLYFGWRQVMTGPPPSDACPECNRELEQLGLMLALWDLPLACIFGLIPNPGEPA